MERIARSPPPSALLTRRSLLTIHHPSYVDLSRNAGSLPMYSAFRPALLIWEAVEAAGPDQVRTIHVAERATNDARARGVLPCALPTKSRSMLVKGPGRVLGISGFGVFAAQSFDTRNFGQITQMLQHHVRGKKELRPPYPRVAVAK